MSPMNHRLLVPRKTPGLLDLVPGAAAAYSLRSLSRSYADPVVTVRRSSDDAEDLFTASEVADGTLAAFCGAGDGFVKQWWDQSGNAVHATASGTAQPKIVDSGVVVSESGKPAISFDGTDDALQTAYAVDFATSKKASVFSVLTYITGVTSLISVSRSGANDYNSGASIAAFPAVSYSEIVVGSGLPSSTYSQHRMAIPPLGQFQWTTIISAADSFVISGYDGATSAVEKAAGSGTVAQWLSQGSALHSLAFGARLLPGLASFSEMKQQEVIVYADDMSSQKELIEGNIAWGYSV